MHLQSGTLINVNQCPITIKVKIDTCNKKPKKKTDTAVVEPRHLKVEVVD